MAVASASGPKSSWIAVGGTVAAIAAVAAVAASTSAAVATVDTDAHWSLARQLVVQGIPTLVRSAGGEPVERLVGLQDRATLEGLVDRYA